MSISTPDCQRRNTKKAFLPLSICVVTYFVLDFFLVHIHGGMKLLFPFSWAGWQVDLIRSDDYMVTIVAVIAAVFVYGIYWVAAKRKKANHAS